MSRPTYAQAMRHFPLAGDIMSASFVGACNALGLRERERWFPSFREAVALGVIPRGRSQRRGKRFALDLERAVGRRRARKWVMRSIRRERQIRRREVDSARHVELVALGWLRMPDGYRFTGTPRWETPTPYRWNAYQGWGADVARAFRG